MDIRRGQDAHTTKIIYFQIMQFRCVLAYPDLDRNKTLSKFIIHHKSKPKKIIKELYSFPKISDY